MRRENGALYEVLVSRIMQRVSRCGLNASSCRVLLLLVRGGSRARVCSREAEPALPGAEGVVVLPG